MNSFICVDRVAFNLFGYDIYWYGLIICFAIILAVAVAIYFCKLKKYDTDMPVNIALVILPAGILSARLFAVLFDDSLQMSDYFNFRTGGMSIIGAVIGGGLALLLYCMVKDKKNTLRYFDVLALVLILAQAVGRWGNFFNSEVYGQEVQAGSMFAFFPFAVNVDGTLYQALFFYEFALNLIAFGMLAVLFLKTKKNGYVTAGYLTLYGIIRTILEPLRQDEYILKFAGLPISRICSFAMIGLGIIIFVTLIINFVKGEKSGKKIEN